MPSSDPNKSTVSKDLDGKLSASTLEGVAIKPPKPEDKPFQEFINNHFIPDLKKAINIKVRIKKSIISK